MPEAPTKETDFPAAPPVPAEFRGFEDIEAATTDFFDEVESSGLPIDQRLALTSKAVANADKARAIRIKRERDKLDPLETAAKREQLLSEIDRSRRARARSADARARRDETQEEIENILTHPQWRGDPLARSQALAAFKLRNAGVIAADPQQRAAISAAEGFIGGLVSQDQRALAQQELANERLRDQNEHTLDLIEETNKFTETATKASRKEAEEELERHKELTSKIEAQTSAAIDDFNKVAEGLSFRETMKQVEDQDGNTIEKPDPDSLSASEKSKRRAAVQKALLTLRLDADEDLAEVAESAAANQQWDKLLRIYRQFTTDKIKSLRPSPKEDTAKPVIPSARSLFGNSN